jgi:hypothetical protein
VKFLGRIFAACICVSIGTWTFYDGVGLLMENRAKPGVLLLVATIVWILSAYYWWTSRWVGAIIVLVLGQILVDVAFSFR